MSREARRRLANDMSGDGKVCKTRARRSSLDWPILSNAHLLKAAHLIMLYFTVKKPGDMMAWQVARCDVTHIR